MIAKTEREFYGDEDFASYTVIDFSCPIIDAWVEEHQDVFCPPLSKENGKVTAKAFFDAVANEIDSFHLIIEIDGEDDVVGNLVSILMSMYTEESVNSFVSFLKKNSKRIEKESSGGIYNTINNDLEGNDVGWPIVIDGVARRNKKTVHYYLELGDDYSVDQDKLEKVLPNCGEREGFFRPPEDVKFYTPKIIEKIYDNCYIGDEEDDDEDY